MSLDVSLVQKYHVTFDSGKTLIPEQREVFEANITHNLTEMAKEAGIYEACWSPYEINDNPKAKDIIPLLEKGLKKMKSNPDYFKKFDAHNGWGTYIDFLPWIEKYLEACKEYPETEIYICK